MLMAKCYSKPEAVTLDVTRGCIPPLGEVPVAVQDVNADVNLCDVLLDLVVHFLLPIFDEILFARRSRSCPGNFYCSIFGR